MIRNLISWFIRISELREFKFVYFCTIQLPFNDALFTYPLIYFETSTNTKCWHFASYIRHVWWNRNRRRDDAESSCVRQYDAIARNIHNIFVWRIKLSKFSQLEDNFHSASFWKCRLILWSGFFCFFLIFIMLGVNLYLCFCIKLIQFICDNKIH